MKIPFQCPQCPETTTDIIEQSPNSNGLYTIECEYGHISHYTIGNGNYEFLSVIATKAFIDGYFRECVSSFTSSLERYYEFRIRLFLHHYISRGSVGGDEGFIDLVDKYWKVVGSSSERQLGSYVALATMITSSMPLILSQKDTAFRNSVIHKGYIPTEKEAADYSQSIIDIVRTTVVHDHTFFGDSYAFFLKNEFRRRHSQLKNGEKVYVFSCSSPYNEAGEGGRGQPIDFRDYAESLILDDDGIRLEPIAGYEKEGS